MKKLFTLMVIAALTLIVNAQSPQRMSYQCVIRNTSGALVPNQAVGMKISILQGSATGTVVYSETYNPNPQTNANGLLTVEIGSGLVISGTFSTIDWSSGPYFLKSETDPAGGTNYTISGTSQLLSVPYALHSKTAETVTGGIAETDPTFAGSQAVNITATDITNLRNLSGTNTGDQDLSGLATKAYVDDLLVRIEALEESDLLNNGFIDIRDGNHYDAVKIGNQIWMAENMKYLPGVVGPGTGSQTTPYYYVYGYNGTIVADAKATANYSIYGVLYNWPATMNGELSSIVNPSGVQGVCPTGWHLPSDAEWTELTDYLGGSSVAGGKLKEIGTAHWNSPNTGATNETGFTALPGGNRISDGSFFDAGLNGYWWSASEYITGYSQGRGMVFLDRIIGRVNNRNDVGFSVRCIKD